MNNDDLRKLRKVQSRLEACRKCNSVCGRPVHGPAFLTRTLLVGQAPGTHEERLGKPFAYTAGRTLFKWFHEATGMNEDELREVIYFTAVARCFPGKAKSGAGDREPSQEEIKNCSVHLRAEIEILKPDLLIAVGKVAIAEVFAAIGYKKTKPLVEIVGQKITTEFHGHRVDVIPLPHPSGVSRWPITEPGKTKLKMALDLIRKEFVKRY